MIKTVTNELNELIKKQSQESVLLIKEFFADFNNHCLISKKETKKIREDFEKAIVYYLDNGVPVERALQLLDVKKLGAFYSRTTTPWFALDDAAKIYPLSLEHGGMAVFRLSVYLNEQINPILLQMALNFTIKRFPSFATTIKAGFFWHYLDTTKRRFTVEPEQYIPCKPLKVSHSNSQSFRVLYFNNRISIEFFHVLTDGTGGVAFLKVLAAEYLRLRMVKIDKDENLWDVDQIPSASELENAFAKVSKTKKVSGFVDKVALQMSGKLSKTRPCQVIHFKMDSQTLKQAAKKYDCTVSAYILACMFIAAKASTDRMSGDISIQVPVDIRKYYSTNTVRNFSMYCGVRLSVEEIDDVCSIIEKIIIQLKEKTEKDVMSQMVTATENLVNGLKLVPLIIKQPITKLVGGVLGDKIFTTTLSNLGVIKIPESMTPYVESMDFVLGPGLTNRANCGLITVNGVTTLTIVKITVDPTFEDKIYSILTESGVKLCVEGSSIYED